MNIGKLGTVDKDICGIISQERHMEKFLKWFATSPIASFLRHFATIVLAAMVAEFAKLGTFDFTNWRSWVISGLVAALPAFLNWLNPKDAGYRFR